MHPVLRGVGVQNNYFSTDDFKTRSDMYSGKLDHTFSQKWSGAVSYVHLATQEPSGNFLHIVEAPDSKLLRYNDATATNQVIMINPTTVLTVATASTAITAMLCHTARDSTRLTALAVPDSPRGMRRWYSRRLSRR